MAVKLKNEPGARTLAEFRPAQDYLVLDLEGDLETEGGLVIPKQDGTMEEHQSPRRATGKVLAAGPGRYADNGAFIEQEYQVGDYVYFRPTEFSHLAPIPVEIGDDLYVLVRAQVVIGSVSADVLIGREDGNEGYE